MIDNYFSAIGNEIISAIKIISAILLKLELCQRFDTTLLLTLKHIIQQVMFYVEMYCFD